MPPALRPSQEGPIEGGGLGIVAAIGPTHPSHLLHDLLNHLCQALHASGRGSAVGGDRGHGTHL